MKHNFRQRVINEYGLPVVKVESVNCELGSGILDKNGNEIFEGDIVKHSEWNIEPYTVLFEDGGLVLRGKKGTYFSGLAGSQLEIVGHIKEANL